MGALGLQRPPCRGGALACWMYAVVRSRCQSKELEEDFSRLCSTREDKKEFDRVFPETLRK